MKKDAEIRKCIVCGEVMEKDNLLRFIAAPDGRIIPDFKKKLPGKGVYVSNSKTSLEKAVSKNLFSKALKKNVKTDSDLTELVEHLIKKNGLDLISLSRKAGILITGFEKVSDSLRKGKVTLVLEAKDAGLDGHNKIMSLAKNIEVFNIYDIEELDQALGKVNTVHVAFEKSEMAKIVYNELKKIEKFLNS